MTTLRYAIRLLSKARTEMARHRNPQLYDEIQQFLMTEEVPRGEDAP